MKKNPLDVVYLYSMYVCHFWLIEHVVNTIANFTGNEFYTFIFLHSYLPNIIDSTGVLITNRAPHQCAMHNYMYNN